jgi:hypothetical protein
MKRHSLVLISAVALLASGCASSTGGAGVGGGTQSQPPGLPAGLVVFQVETSGGFVPIDYALGGRPSLTIYGDGTAFTVVEDDTYHPVIALQQGSVDADTLGALIEAAGSSGLFGDVDFGTPGVTDLGTTTLSFRPQPGAAQRASAYALGFDDDGPSSGLSAEQQNRRHALSALIKDLVESVTYPTAGGSWTPNRVEVLDLSDSSPNDAHPTQWPGPDLSAVLTLKTANGPCGEVSGADAAAVFSAARDARSSAWISDDRTYHLVVRALLPGESACTM